MGILGSDCGSGDLEKWATLGYFAVHGAKLIDWIWNKGRWWEEINDDLQGFWNS